MENILVVGGAGYIGSYMCKLLHRNGFLPVVLDSLVYGHREAVQWGPFYHGSLADRSLLKSIFEEHRIAAVMHFAAYCYVGESVAGPARYYRNNVASTLDLLEAMVENQINRFIFSSSCATYGEPVAMPIAEDHPQNPISPYGRTKLMVEQILADFHHAYGVNAVSLRYFNAAGADPEAEVGEDHRPETHLIPLVLQVALGQRECIDVFGDDYPTRDGTCIRDYIHIHDLAGAHLLALERLLSGAKGGAYNLGNGNGYSVREVIDTASEITGRHVAARIVDRRAGDPAELVGSSEKAAAELGWQPEYPDLNAIVESAWEWHRKNPHGYQS